jgi:hypothetical protein
MIIRMTVNWLAVLIVMMCLGMQHMTYADKQEWFVSPEGDDSWSGRLSAANPDRSDGPFRTLKKAGDVTQPGDICILRGGVYRETLHPSCSGTAAKPIVFRAFPGETPVLSGADPVGDWRDEGDGLWSAPMGWDLADRNQLFADGKMLAEARWPRTPIAPDIMFKPVRAVATSGTATSLTDPNLTGDADAWKGALLWCAGGAKWICWASRITGFDPVTNTLSFELRKRTTDVNWYMPEKGSEYVIIGARAALGSPGEWWFDGAAKRIWLCPPASCATPDKAGVEAKRRLTAIDLRGRSHIHMQGLHFLAGGILTDAESAYLRLEGLRGEYVAHSYAKDVSADAVVIDGHHNLLFNCEFRSSSAAVVRISGTDQRVINCLTENGNYGGMWSGAMTVSGRRQLVRYNSVRHSGRDLLSLHGLTESVLEYNDLSFAGWLTHDLGITYGHDTDFGGTRIRWNHVHDCVAQGLAQGIYFDHCSHNVVVHDNLFWNIPDMPVQINNPSYFNLVMNNTARQTNTRTRKIITYDHSNRQDLYGTQFLNNIFNAPFKLPANISLSGNRIVANVADSAPNGAKLSTSAIMNTQAEAWTPMIEKSLCWSSNFSLSSFNLAAFDSAPDLPWKAGRDMVNPPDPEALVECPLIPGMNLLSNPMFERGSLEGWTAGLAGRAEIVAGNGWGNKVNGSDRNFATGTSKWELRLTEGGSVAQTIKVLHPKQRYRLSGWLHVAATGQGVELRVRDFGGKEISVSCSTVEWMRVELEFTTGPDSSSATVEIRQVNSASPGQSWADNLGLVEIE